MAEHTLEIEMAEVTTRYRLTADQFLRMAEVGILPEDARLELVDGEILAMSPAGPRHHAAVSTLDDLFVPLRGHGLVRVQMSVRFGPHDRREPDLAVVRVRSDRYSARDPRADDVLLLVEVAQSSLSDDRTRKGPLYARFGVPEYWILNLSDDLLEVHREPREEGYALRRILRAGERVAPLAFPDFEVAVSDLLVSPAS